MGDAGDVGEFAGGEEGADEGSSGVGAEAGDNVAHAFLGVITVKKLAATIFTRGITIYQLKFNRITKNVIG